MQSVPVDDPGVIGEFAAADEGLVMRGLIGTIVLTAALSAVLPVLAQAESADAARQRAQTERSAMPTTAIPTDVSAQSRRARPRVRIYGQPRTYPGPRSVRVCNARLVPQYRPSGTVIVPRMNCYWEG